VEASHSRNVFSDPNSAFSAAISAAVPIRPSSNSSAVRPKKTS